VTGPEEPGDDWEGFPEVVPADPTSTALPEPEPEVYDTGSDAWWRQQADAQRQAASTEPVVPPTPPVEPEPVQPPPLVEPTVLTAPPEPPQPAAAEPTPLDPTWVPPHLPELRTPEPVAEPVVAEPAADWAEPVTEQPGYDDEPAYLDEAAAEPLSADPVAVPAAVVDEPRTRAPYDGQEVGRGRAWAGGALALAGVILGIGALFLFNSKDDSGQGPTVALPPTTSATPSVAPSETGAPSPSVTVSAPPVVAPTAVATTAAPAAAPVVPVSVLNNSKRKGLAATAAARFKAGGWPVPQTGNYRGQIQRTTVYYGAGQQASAERFAKQFGIARVLPRSALPGIPVQGMTVVLTRDYSA
jgi:hypothetical protein